jgi:hypothetical protein
MKPTTIAKLKEPQNQEYFNEKVQLVIGELAEQLASRETVKEILADLKAKFDISPSLVRKLCKAKADDSVDKLLQDNSEIVSLVSVLK